jgi:hypothetical protein
VHVDNAMVMAIDRQYIHTERKVYDIISMAISVHFQVEYEQRENVHFILIVVITIICSKFYFKSCISRILFSIDFYFYFYFIKFTVTVRQAVSLSALSQSADSLCSAVCRV